MNEAKALNAVSEVCDMGIGNGPAWVEIGDGKHLQWDLQDHDAGVVCLDRLLLGHGSVPFKGCLECSERH
ncbi:hypothetical protein [Yoonia sp. R2-816]|uniref:hypothetical protein n=1 Tax=Yoonia sp. R2-816 TaxID=3342638 RepID=UPI00372C89AD